MMGKTTAAGQQRLERAELYSRSMLKALNIKQETNKKAAISIHRWGLIANF